VSRVRRRDDSASSMGVWSSSYVKVGVQLVQAKGNVVRQRGEGVAREPSVMHFLKNELGVR
jgi:hypothetical protein